MTLYEIILHSITIITIIFQAYLFYLIRYKSPKSMQNYKFYLNYFTFWDLLFTILMGSFLQPEPTGFLMSFHIFGISSWIGPRAEIFTASAIFYTGFNLFLAQDYCLLFRYASLHGKRLHDLFSSNKMKVLLFIVSQIIGLIIFFTFYSILIPPEVNLSFFFKFKLSTV